jgi:hypothetical protein
MGYADSCEIAARCDPAAADQQTAVGVGLEGMVVAKCIAGRVEQGRAQQFAGGLAQGMAHGRGP